MSSDRKQEANKFDLFRIFLYVGISVSSALLALFVPLMLVSAMSFAAPGSNYNPGLLAFNWIVRFYPIPLGCLLAYVFAKRHATNRPMVGVAGLWATIAATCASLAICAVVASKVHPLEMDRFDDPHDKRLIVAIIRNDTYYVNAHIKSGRRLDFSGERGINALYAAIIKERWVILDILLESGYPINKVPSKVEFFAPRYLLKPAEGPVEDDMRLKYLKRLLEAGLQPTALWGQTTLLHEAISNRAVDALELLLMHSPDASLRDGNGISLLDTAVHLGRWECAEILLASLKESDLDSAVLLMERQEVRGEIGIDRPNRLAFKKKLLEMHRAKQEPKRIRE